MSYFGDVSNASDKLSETRPNEQNIGQESGKSEKRGGRPGRVETLQRGGRILFAKAYGSILFDPGFGGWGGVILLRMENDIVLAIF
ncbi:hypothetical protein TNIN_109161 [Trichonephila inaurata madagascariensis]|uniref:Uncharacterized protein n=1 Tax=Trichonephila inaurata madagascariensis TaxID=2747483 RepID=A0A8X6JRA9_9ARAC|nr:hypothetical protein TNIN_109161 [Trichonephila inaurata madagascariensis]